MRFRLIAVGDEIVRSDANGQCLQPYLPSRHLDAVDSALNPEQTAQGHSKMLEMQVGVERDQIRAQQAG